MTRPHPPVPALSRLVRDLPTPTGFGGSLVPSQFAFDLIGGSPTPEALPAVDLAVAATEILTAPGAAREHLNYSDARGNPALRAWLAAREGVDVDRVLIVNGALHGISLVTRALIDPGDVVVAEDPTFVIARRTFEMAGAQVTSLPAGPDRFVERLATALQGGLRPRIVYVIPDFQNPTGGVLGDDDRRRLVELAERHGFVLLWDNPYRPSRFAGTDRADVDIGSSQVVKVDTFSKSLGPGLRLGWLVLPPHLVDPIINIRRRTDQQPATLTQALVAAVATAPGRFDAIVAGIRAAHGARAAALTLGLAAAAGDRLRFDAPQGGFFLWATIADPAIDPGALRAAALAEGVLWVEGNQFAAVPGGESARAIRLGFTTATPDQLTGAAAAIGRALDRVVGARRNRVAALG